MVVLALELVICESEWTAVFTNLSTAPSIAASLDGNRSLVPLLHFHPFYHSLLISPTFGWQLFQNHVFCSGFWVCIQPGISFSYSWENESCHPLKIKIPYRDLLLCCQVPEGEVLDYICLFQERNTFQFKNILQSLRVNSSVPNHMI